MIEVTRKDVGLSKCGVKWLIVEIGVFDMYHGDGFWYKKHVVGKLEWCQSELNKICYGPHQYIPQTYFTTNNFYIRRWSNPTMKKTLHADFRKHGIPNPVESIQKAMFSDFWGMLAPTKPSVTKETTLPSIAWMNRI